MVGAQCWMCQQARAGEQETGAFMQNQSSPMRGRINQSEMWLKRQTHEIHSVVILWIPLCFRTGLILVCKRSRAAPILQGRRLLFHMASSKHNRKHWELTLQYAEWIRCHIYRLATGNASHIKTLELNISLAASALRFSVVWRDETEVSVTLRDASGNSQLPDLRAEACVVLALRWLWWSWAIQTFWVWMLLRWRAVVWWGWAVSQHWGRVSSRALSSRAERGQSSSHCLPTLRVSAYLKVSHKCNTTHLTAFLFKSKHR